MDYFALGKRIRKRRVEQGMTQEQLARQVGVTTSFIGQSGNTGSAGQRPARGRGLPSVRQPEYRA